MPKVAMQSVGLGWKVAALIHELEFASVGTYVGAVVMVLKTISQ